MKPLAISAVIAAGATGTAVAQDRVWDGTTVELQSAGPSIGFIPARTSRQPMAGW